MPYASKILTGFVEVLEGLGEGLTACRDGVLYTFCITRESSKGWGGGDWIPRLYAQSALITLFFVRVGEIGVKEG